MRSSDPCRFVLRGAAVLSAAALLVVARPTPALSTTVGVLDFKGGKLRSPTELCVGATIDLGLGLEAQTKLTHRKVEAGVRYFLMQAVFDPALVRRFLDGYADTYGEELTSPVFCGVQVVTTDGMVFGDVPEWITADLEKGRDAADVALEVLGTFVDAGFRSIYLVPPILRAGRRDYAAATRVLKGFRP